MLPQVVYVAVCCKVCQRTSAVTFKREDLAKKLAEQQPIELFCAYDNERWDASARELIGINALLHEANYEI